MDLSPGEEISSLKECLGLRQEWRLETIMDVGCQMRACCQHPAFIQAWGDRC